MLTLHQFYISPFCDKIRRQLHWKGLQYKVVEYPLMTRKAIKKICAAGKLPCLEHDGKFIGDSTDIALYIEQQFPTRPLLPSDPAGRALVHIMEDWADESLYMYEMYLRFRYKHNAQYNIPRLLHADKPLSKKLMPKLIRKRVVSTLTSQGLARKPGAWILKDVERHIDALADLLGSSEWLVGDSLSLADLSVYSMIACMHDSREGQAIIHQQAKVVDWMKRVENATGGKIKGSLPTMVPNEYPRNSSRPSFPVRNEDRQPYRLPVGGAMTESAEPQYAVVLTSCRRFDLLRQTVESFLHFADVLPQQFIVVEDSGDETVRDVLAEFDYPFEIVIRPPELVQCNDFDYSLYRLGQRRLSAAIDAGYVLVKTPLVFHCEDDWLFLRSGFIRESQVLLQRFPEIARVGLRSIQAPVASEEHQGVRFFRIDSEICPQAKTYVYSYNPGLRRMSDYHAIAPTANISSESMLSEVFGVLGFNAAYLQDPAIEHIGDGRNSTGTPPGFIVSVNTSWKNKILSKIAGKISRRRRIHYQRAAIAKLRAHAAKAASGHV